MGCAAAALQFDAPDACRTLMRVANCTHCLQIRACFVEKIPHLRENIREITMLWPANKPGLHFAPVLTCTACGKREQQTNVWSKMPYTASGGYCLATDAWLDTVSCIHAGRHIIPLKDTGSQAREGRY